VVLEKISGTDRVINELQRLKVERTILQTIKGMKATWIGHILYMNCLLKHITEGKTEGRIGVMGRRGRRCKQLLEDLKVKRGYWKLKEAQHISLLQALLHLKYVPNLGLNFDIRCIVLHSYLHKLH